MGNDVRIGVIFPQIEFGNDPVAIRDYAQTVEGLGYTHFLAYDHVLGADASDAGPAGAGRTRARTPSTRSSSCSATWPG